MQPPPLFQRLRIKVNGFDWKEGYCAEYSGRARAVIDGWKGHWAVKDWDYP